jgi:hypothetical protein
MYPACSTFPASASASKPMSSGPARAHAWSGYTNRLAAGRARAGPAAGGAAAGPGSAR